ncbi:MAG: excinuclease ABC subunit UvrC [Spirochaetaceae bacterium]|nr:MAG: excinuclease ABC subunit UvrC [Spirochaetaceae bacterium]
MSDDLKSSIRDFPASPGVYLMYDAEGRVIYVGKAKSLRSRVLSYFRNDNPLKTRILVSRVERIEYLVTGNEYEALLLENNLIKRHSPRYNINLKDGKSYPVIRITNDTYPRIFRTRRIVQDGSLYFGPYTDSRRIDAYLELVDKLYPLRKCRTVEIKQRDAPCLYYHIGRCAAVCAGKTSREEYMRRVAAIRSLLEGKTGPLRKELTEKMHAAGIATEYERAAEMRDALQALEQIESEQRVVDFDPEVRDYIGFAAGDELSAFVVFQMRGGRIAGNSVFHGELPGTDEENVIEFVLRFYSSTGTVPRRLYTSATLGDLAVLHRFFREELHQEVEILPPSTKRDAAILRLCTENARQELEKRTRARGNRPGLEELATVLRLRNPPLRIEGFDIAQVGGRNTVASLVSFSNGIPDRGEYKRFRIRSLPEGQVDDFAAMREVLARRYSRVKNEKLPRPDLIVVDGGKGQVGAAREIIGALGLSIPIVGLAKREEEIFLPGLPDPLRLPQGNPGLRVLQHIRDEAHRFATTYRASLQKKEVVTSLLEEIPGIGPRRAARILQAFPDGKSLLETPVDIIAGSTGISEVMVRAVQEKLRSL